MAASRSRTLKASFAAALVVLAALAVIAAPAFGHGGATSVAKRPALNQDPLRLVGAGGYSADRRHAGGVRVTVCLERRYSGNFVAVRCNTNSAAGSKVGARVGVPGCVRGVWRTVAYGQAQNAAGEWRHAAIDASRRFRCD
jgi:hypothetical protein